MKKAILLLVLIISITSCEEFSKGVKDGYNDAKKEATIKEVDAPGKTTKQNDGLTLLAGDFIYYADAAVLQTRKEVYGVIVDSKMEELNQMAAKFKKEATDMVKVQVRGKIIPKQENAEGWPFNIEIKEIMSVKPIDAKNNEVIKIGK